MLIVWDKVYKTADIQYLLRQMGMFPPFLLTLSKYFSNFFVFLLIKHHYREIIIIVGNLTSLLKQYKIFKEFFLYVSLEWEHLVRN